MDRKKNKKKKIIIISTSVTLVVAIILGLLAYRYLIERVEATVVNTVQSVSSVEYSEATSDDWNYSRDGLQISIKRVTEGSGNNTITYYVAARVGMGFTSDGYMKIFDETKGPQTFKELGCTEAYNLDGGGSSTMYFMGRVVNNPLGKGTER